MVNNYTAKATSEFYSSHCDAMNQIHVSGVYPQNKVERVLQCGDSNNSDQWVEFLIPEIVSIPTQKPDIESVVEVHSCIDIISSRVIKTPVVTGYTNDANVEIPGEDIPNSECTRLTGRKLIVEGILRLKVVYTANVSEQSIHSASYTTPFSTFIIVAPNTALSQNFRVYPYIEDLFAFKLSNRSIFTNATIFIKVSPLC